MLYLNRAFSKITYLFHMECHLEMPKKLATVFALARDQVVVLGFGRKAEGQHFATGVQEHRCGGLKKIDVN